MALDMTQKRKVTVIGGDGIGPEVMKATLEVLDASGALVVQTPDGPATFVAGDVHHLRRR